MLKALIVDDSLILRRNINKMLTEMGHRVVSEAKDGMEAVSCFKKFEPDFITMDITMPDMDGIEAVAEIRKLSKTVKIIMVTSHGQEEMVMGAIKAGANGYVLKPVNMDNLTKAIYKIYPELAKEAEAKLQAEAKLKEELKNIHGQQSSDDDDLKLEIEL